jgi:hypothetical protein
MPRDLCVRFDAHDQIPMMAPEREAPGPHPQRPSTVTYKVYAVPDNVPDARVLATFTPFVAIEIFQQSISHSHHRSYSPWRVNWSEIAP